MTQQITFVMKCSFILLSYSKHAIMTGTEMITAILTFWINRTLSVHQNLYQSTGMFHIHLDTLGDLPPH